MMQRRHVTHLLARYVHGQLRPAQQARVVNHIRDCDSCRVALVREERFAADLRRELPAVGQPRAGQLAEVWAGVLSEISTGAPRRRRVNWLSAVSVALAMSLVLLVALPLMAAGDGRVEAAPLQPRPINTASPTPGATDTLVAVNTVAQPAAATQPVIGETMPHATVAQAINAGSARGAQNAGATPAPVPGIQVSPGAPER